MERFKTWTCPAYAVMVLALTAAGVSAQDEQESDETTQPEPAEEVGGLEAEADPDAGASEGDANAEESTDGGESEGPDGPTDAAPLPEGVAGDWFWGSISPTQYRDRDTGELVGHGHSGALSYVFEEGGTYKRYFYLEIRLGDDVSSIFSASEGTVEFTEDTFTLKPTKGTYRFVDGPRKDPREREMTQDELERPGLVFTWRLERKPVESAGDGEPPDGGEGDEDVTVMVIGKEGEEPREFSRGTGE